MNTRHHIANSYRIVGLVVFFYMAVVFFSKLLHAADHVYTNIILPFKNWRGEPTAYLIIYFIGYLITWKNKYLGAVIIMIDCMIWWSINPSNVKFLLLFVVPPFVVGITTIMSWYYDRSLYSRKNII